MRLAASRRRAKLSVPAVDGVDGAPFTDEVTLRSGGRLGRGATGSEVQTALATQRDASIPGRPAGSVCAIGYR